MEITAMFIFTGLLTGGWWTFMVTYYDPAEFTRIAEVESDRWFNYNVRPFYYYWSFFTQSGIWTIPALMGLFTGILNPVFHKSCKPISSFSSGRLYL
jgi:hypothetical protein